MQRKMEKWKRFQKVLRQPGNFKFAVLIFELCVSAKSAQQQSHASNSIDYQIPSLIWMEVILALVGPLPRACQEYS